MSASEMVLVCALGLLGRSAGDLPPITVLATRPTVVSAQADAFIDRTTGTIYLIASAPAFSSAMASARSHRRPCDELEGIRMVASIIAHEAWHLERHGTESEAYLAQLTELHRLGLGPGTPEHTSVRRAMNTVVERERQRAAASAQATVIARR